MPRRRNLVLTATALAAAGIVGHAFADDASVIDYLLVQTAKGLAFDKATNMLRLMVSVLSHCSLPIGRNVSPEI